MTNQEAKEKIFYQWQDFLEHNLDYAGISEAYKMAIKALEQGDVLDKIRAEVKSIDTVKELVDSHMAIIKSPQMIKDEVLEIIDRYEAESEG